MSFLSLASIWVLVGFALVLAEFLVSGFILVFFGTSAILVGILVAFGLQGSTAQVFVFAVATVLQIVFLRQRFAKTFRGRRQAGEDEMIVGTAATVVADFAQGHGQVRLQGAVWAAQAPSETALHAGDPVVVTRVDGLTLHVRPRD